MFSFLQFDLDLSQQLKLQKSSSFLSIWLLYDWSHDEIAIRRLEEDLKEAKEKINRLEAKIESLQEEIKGIKSKSIARILYEFKK